MNPAGQRDDIEVPVTALDMLHAVLEIDRRKAAARSVITKINAARATRLPIWWRWTTGLAAAITIRRIDAA